MKHTPYLLSVFMIALVTSLVVSKADAEEGPYLEVRHEGTGWAGQGQCWFRFRFDSAGGPTPLSRMTNVVIRFQFMANGRRLYTEDIRIRSIGGVNAHRYGEAAVAGPCGVKRFAITSATARIRGRRVNLIGNGLSTSIFRPVPISIPKRK